MFSKTWQFLRLLQILGPWQLYKLLVRSHDIIFDSFCPNIMAQLRLFVSNGHMANVGFFLVTMCHTVIWQ